MASVEQLLVDAVKSGDVVALDSVLRDHARTDVNLKTAEGLNLLMVAIRGRYRYHVRASPLIGRYSPSLR